MENLAYLHSVQASETDAIQLDWQLFPRQFPPKTTWVKVLSIPLSLTILTTATNALAFLRRGDSGAEVVNLQNQLKSLGYFQGKSTGFFASMTIEAVNRFQADQGLPQDGIVGEKTQAAIDARLGAVSAANPAITSTTTPVYSGNLYQGATGTAVSKLQDDLRVTGCYTAATTGIFDQATEDSVIKFQQSQGLQADGIAGAKTLAALASLGGVSQNPAPIISTNPSSNTSPQSLARSPLNPTITLQLNSRGEDVRTLQMKLAQLGYYTGGINGTFDDKTAEAVTRFQKDRGLTADGTVKADTWAELAAQ